MKPFRLDTLALSCLTCGLWLLCKLCQVNGLSRQLGAIEFLVLSRVSPVFLGWGGSFFFCWCRARGRGFCHWGFNLFLRRRWLSWSNDFRLCCLRRFGRGLWRFLHCLYLGWCRFRFCWSGLGLRSQVDLPRNLGTIQLGRSPNNFGLRFFCLYAFCLDRFFLLPLLLDERFCFVLAGFIRSKTLQQEIVLRLVNLGVSILFDFVALGLEVVHSRVEADVQLTENLTNSVTTHRWQISLLRIKIIDLRILSSTRNALLRWFRPPNRSDEPHLRFLHSRRSWRYRSRSCEAARSPILRFRP